MLNRDIAKKVTIIGAGWLGMPLALSLIQAGKEVAATKRTAESSKALEAKLSALTSSEDLTLSPFSDELLNKGLLSPAALHTLFYHRQVIITIPPTPFIRRYSKEKENQGIVDYAAFIQTISQLAMDHHAIEIIYTSSTSVYGNSSGIIHEELPAMPQTVSAKAIYQAEKTLEQSSLPVTILRLAGLIGHGRHPIFALQGRNSIRSPLNAINLLHIQDLIKAITVILSRNKSTKNYDIYNLVTPMHPNRKSYYQTVAKQLSLPLPIFESPKPELKRIIDGGKITEQGDFHYQIIDLLQASLEKII